MGKKSKNTDKAVKASRKKAKRQLLEIAERVVAAYGAMPAEQQIQAIEQYAQSLGATDGAKPLAEEPVPEKGKDKAKKAAKAEKKAAKVEKEAKAAKEPKEEKAAKAEKEPKTAKAEKEPKAAKAEKEPKTAKAEKEPKAAKAEKEPKAAKAEKEPKVEQTAKETKADKAEQAPDGDAAAEGSKPAPAKPQGVASPVKDLSSGEVFPSIAAAARAMVEAGAAKTESGAKSAILRCAKGQRKSALGRAWAYVEE